MVHMQTRNSVTDFAFEVFFDGECPLCRREISMLRRLDTAHRLRLTDITQREFDAAELGTDHSTLMRRIHGRMPDGTWVTGVEVFRQLYAAVGFERAVRFSRWRPISIVLDFFYERFAANRLALTGRRCDDACPIQPQPKEVTS